MNPPRTSKAPMTLDHRMLALMATDEGLSKVIESGMGPEVIEEPILRVMFSWIVDQYCSTNRRAPTALMLSEEFPSVLLPHAEEIEESADWTIGSLQNRYATNELQDVMRRIATNMFEDPSAALQNMRDECDVLIHQAGLGDREQSEPIPLTSVVPVPPFPVDALPTPFGAMAASLAKSTQTDPAMSATAILSVLSACHGGYARIEIRHGWQEPLCLYTATIASPGERKSAVQQAVVSPLLELEKNLAIRGSLDRLEAETRKQIATRKAEKLAQAASRDAEKIDEALQAAHEAEAVQVPALPRLIADDVTPEAAGSLLAEQGGRLAIISAEGGIFGNIAGRYSNQINLDLWLKAHAGDMVKVDRKGRPSEYIEKPALTLGLMIQPSVLSTIAANHEFRGRGLLARFLYAMPVSRVGHREVSTPIDQEVEKSYSSAVQALALVMRNRGMDTAVLTLSEEAKAEFQRIEITVEGTLATGGELASLIDWGAKYVGAVARIAGILHLAEHGAKEGPDKSISVGTIEAAERIGQYFKASAVNAFAEMGCDTATSAAVYLLERIHHHGLDVVSERELLRNARKFKTKQELNPAIERLVQHGYLSRLSSTQSSVGRPGSQCYRVHASVFASPSTPVTAGQNGHNPPNDL